ncbi:MAG: hypothetical protein GWM98_01750, partial [Nitrospinaceae bacterium]|nr:hypothetical protein [Nitrospinaceae bacterium]NIR53465.1 hypothetical protein [Nitrospinaceae bacterium]NIT80661.1 hypothetical protein [Nitrospinaceae bacterium]NIX33065.1 hypothetical protein [Nitrospinaceae bacterium]NIY13685.1 hypothetical protein [Nitrospinaceae bacterium]
KPPKKETGDILPPLSLPRQKDTEGLAGGVRVLIKDIKVLGNTVLPEIKIAEIINPYVGKEMNMGDIEAVRDQLTKAYIRAGYINSGATIP